MLSGRRGGGCLGTRAAGRGGRPAAGRGIGRMPLGNRSITGVVPGVLVGSLGAPFGFASLILWFFSSYITRMVVALNDSIIGKSGLTATAARRSCLTWRRHPRADRRQPRNHAGPIQVERSSKLPGITHHVGKTIQVNKTGPRVELDVL